MSLFGSIMGDFDEDPFFGSHMRHMRQMNSMMNSFFDPFGMLGDMGGPLAITGGPLGAAGGPLAVNVGHHRNALMHFMPQMPTMNMNRLMSVPGADLMGGHCNSFSSSTIVMSNGLDGRPQVISSSSSTQLGPNGVKETRRTMQDTRTGTKKMAIGHHIGERAHVIEREQNVISGDQEERQEYINIDEEEADDFNREFEERSHVYRPGRQHQRAIAASSAGSRSPQLALPAPPNASPRQSLGRLPSARRPLRKTSNPLPSMSTNSTPSSVARQTYGSLHPQRKHHPRHHKKHRDASDN